MKRHNIKVYPLAIQVILGNLSHQKAVVIILSTRRQAATQLLYYPRVNKLGENIKNQYLFPSIRPDGIHHKSAPVKFLELGAQTEEDNRMNSIKWSSAQWGMTVGFL